MNEQQTADTQNVQTTEQTQITTPIAGTETQPVPVGREHIDSTDAPKS